MGNILLLWQLIVLITLSSYCALTCQEEWLLKPNSQRLIPPWLSLIKCDISNQLLPCIDHLKEKDHFLLI